MVCFICVQLMDECLVDEQIVCVCWLGEELGGRVCVCVCVCGWGGVGGKRSISSLGNIYVILIL